MNSNMPIKPGKPAGIYKKNRAISVRMHDETYLMLKELMEVYGKEQGKENISKSETIEQLIRDAWRNQMNINYED